VILVSQVRAFFLSTYVLYIIWAALLLYHVVNEAGGIRAISEHVSHLTSDQVMQFLLLAWAFASFLQGITGFGVPTAVVAPLLIGLGFDPMAAVVGTTLAHGWAVTFGSVASSFYAMLAVTDANPHEFAAPAAFLLGLAAYGCGAVAAHVVRGWRGIARAFVPLLLMGTVMAVVQYLLAVAGLWNIAAFGGGAAGVIVGALWAWWRAPATAPPREQPTMSLWLAVNAYSILLVLFLLVTFVQPLGNLLDRVQLTLSLPTVETTLGWRVDAGRARPISLFGHAGAIITYAALLAALVYARLGCAFHWRVGCFHDWQQHQFQRGVWLFAGRDGTCAGICPHGHSGGADSGRCVGKWAGACQTHRRCQYGRSGGAGRALAASHIGVWHAVTGVRGDRDCPSCVLTCRKCAHSGLQLCADYHWIAHCASGGVKVRRG